MELLIAVIQREECLEEILAGFLELGIPGATLLRSEGMARHLTVGGDLPAFAGLQALKSRARPQNHTLFSVVDDPEKSKAAIELLQNVCGRFEDPATGIAFTVPVGRVVGLAGPLSNPSAS